MDTIYWHMNATQGGCKFAPGVNLLPVQICTRVQIVHMNVASDTIRGVKLKLCIHVKDISFCINCVFIPVG